MSDQSVIAITVNYKTPRLTTEMIQSIIDTQAKVKLIIVDNNSQDDSVEVIQRFIDQNQLDWVTLLPRYNNLGYAGGNNEGLAHIREHDLDFDYIWFLNPDTKLRPDALQNLLKEAESNNYPIVGSRLEDEDGTPQVSAFNFPSPISELCSGARMGILDRFFKRFLVRTDITNTNTPCDWLAGASLLVSRSVYETIGPMNDAYFLYYEELEYLLKANRAGYQCWYTPSSRVYHAVGAATGISDARKKAPRRPEYWFNSRRRYFLTNYGAFTLFFVDTLFIAGYSSWLLRKKLTRSKDLENEPAHFLCDYIKHSIFFRGTKVL